MLNWNFAELILVSNTNKFNKVRKQKRDNFRGRWLFNFGLKSLDSRCQFCIQKIYKRFTYYQNFKSSTIRVVPRLALCKRKRRANWHLTGNLWMEMFASTSKLFENVTWIFNKYKYLNGFNAVFLRPTFRFRHLWYRQSFTPCQFRFFL